MTPLARTAPNTTVPTTTRTAACVVATALRLPTALPSLFDDTGPLPVIERVLGWLHRAAKHIALPRCLWS